MMALPVRLQLEHLTAPRLVVLPSACPRVGPSRDLGVDGRVGWDGGEIRASARHRSPK